MAGDWIKMRIDIADDPAVIGIASALDITEDEVVGKLHRIAQHPRFAQARFPKMRHWSAGGSPMPLALLETWANKGVTICFGFGRPK